MRSIVVLSVLLFVGLCIATPLDDYVNAPDATYKWSVNHTFSNPNMTAYVLQMTSQTWLTANDSSCPVWHHWIVVCVPKTIKYNSAFVFVDGGHITDLPPTSVSPIIEVPCVAAHTITAHLMGIPNEPITFADGKRRSEDAIIAYTWDKYMNDTANTSPVWLLQLPMVKAAVRALDTLQAFSKQIGSPIEGFVVGGGSKRGWVTWLTGAVDKRVTAIVPIVMPILNMSANMNHHWQAYGAWSFALSDYLDMHVMRFLNQPPFTAMANIIDPFVYRDRLTMPKYVVSACGDEFFLPDSPRFYWPALTGQKWMRVVPNAEHTLEPQDMSIMRSITTFYVHLLAHEQLPTVTWTYTPLPNGHAILRVQSTGVLPTAVTLWRAHTFSRVRRDFRLIICDDASNPGCLQPVIWVAKSLAASSTGIYEAELTPAATGWEGYNIELEFNSHNQPEEFIFKVSTEVFVLPDTLPFPSCGNNCQPSTSASTDDLLI